MYENKLTTFFNIYLDLLWILSREPSLDNIYWEKIYTSLQDFNLSTAPLIVYDNDLNCANVKT